MATRKAINIMDNLIRKFWFAGLILLVFYPSRLSAQSVGIGTNNPNRNAALDVTASSGDQGILLPRLSGAQRNSMSLGNAERGLIVYDTTDNIFYYWDGSQWLAGLGDATGSTDFQTLAFDQATAILSIENGNTVDLSSLINDADPDPSNELITDFRATATELEIVENGVVHSVPFLSLPGIGNQSIISFQLSGLLNEELEILLDNDILGIKTVNLHSIGFTDASDLTGTLGTAVIKPNSVTTNKIQDGAITDAKIADVEPSKINQAGANIGDVLKWNGTAWVPEIDETGAISATTSYYAVDPSDFIEVYRQNTSADKNNLVIFRNADDFVTLRIDSDGDEIMAPVHLPHNSTVQRITFYYFDSQGPNIQFRFVERSFGSGSNVLASVNSNENANALNSKVITGPFVIDNSTKSYVINIRLNIPSEVRMPNDADHGVYGVMIEYTP